MSVGLRVDIWSDVVCPWCYLGTRRFGRALEAFEHGARVDVVHRSFQLDPAKPSHETSSRRKMLMGKYRLSEAQVVAMDAQMERTAAADGLAYHLTERGLTGNTFLAHQMVHLGARRGLGDQVLDRLYRAYFTEERSVFEVTALVELGAEAGLDPAEARAALERHAYAEAVNDDLRQARALGISGVPFFLIDGRLGVSGAQSIDVFREALARAWASEATASGSARS